jgi:hypothetical protein
MRRPVRSPRARSASPPLPPDARSAVAGDALSFSDVTRLIHAADEQVAATDPHPTDPSADSTSRTTSP